MRTQITDKQREEMDKKAADAIVQQRKRTAAFVRDYCEHVNINMKLSSIKYLLERLDGSTVQKVLKEQPRK
jgi:hypothetical protein